MKLLGHVFTSTTDKIKAVCLGVELVECKAFQPRGPKFDSDSRLGHLSHFFTICPT